MAMEIDEKVTTANGHGTMVIRVWREPVNERALRIRMTFQGDSSGEPTTIVAADADQVMATVKDSRRSPDRRFFEQPFSKTGLTQLGNAVILRCDRVLSGIHKTNPTLCLPGI